jgi:Flp pilus assembly pilin Flp
MKNLMHICRSFWIEQEGGEVVEYALVIGLLVIGLAAIVIAIRNGASNKFTTISHELQTN